VLTVVALVMAAIVTVIIVIVVTAAIVVMATAVVLIARLSAKWCCLALASLDDFVYLATVQPNAPALRTVIDLDSLTVAHYKSGVIYWTLHSVPFLIQG
jgi:hypothetical protein